ncbi:MAG: cation:dicarboxylase symporter family transporter [Chitinophagaceae bacterium]|nr:cation:dicarboxylase symporter family transporter [Chitinophagaceae bacterium]
MAEVTMATNEISINYRRVIFVFFGVGINLQSVKGETKPMLDFQSLADMVLKMVTNIMMYLAPVGVFGAIAAAIGKLGWIF